MARATAATSVSPARKAVLRELLAAEYQSSDSAQTHPGKTRGPGAIRPFDSLAAQDRGQAERTWRGVLQNLRLLDLLLDRSGRINPKRTALPLRWILRIAIYEKIFMDASPDYAIGQQSVEMAKSAGGQKAGRFVNGVLRGLLGWLPEGEDSLDSFLAELGGTPPPAAVRYSIPDDLANELGRGYGRENLPAILRSMNEPETRVWLRVNSLKTSIEDTQNSLEAEGCEADRTDLAPGVLRWDPSSTPPWKTECWKRGEITVQDLGAMLPVWLMNPQPGESVADWCAAPGGKTGQIWEAMEGKGTLTALEIEYTRRKELQSSVYRLYGKEMRGDEDEIEISSSSKNTSRTGAYQVILLDSPCLALGLLRRHPEARWDDRLARKAGIRKKQTAILDDAAARLAPGGRIVWAVCSPTRLELEELIEPWLAKNSAFRLMDPKPRIPEWARAWTQVDGCFVRTRPDLAPVDGFGTALLQRL